jgi:hypothetical protein
MPRRVVDPLEVIDVDSEDCDLRLVARRTVNHLIERVLEAVSVEAAGQLVGERDLGQLGAHVVVGAPEQGDGVGLAIARFDEGAAEVAPLRGGEEVHQSGQPLVGARLEDHPVE